MTSTEQFISRAEHELRTSRRLGADTLHMWRDLDELGQRAFAHAVEFLGGQNGVENPGSTRIEDRLAASRLMLLNLGLDGTDPLWSSYVLEQYVTSVITTPDGSLDDVFRPLLDLLTESNRELTPPLAHFIEDVVRFCFGCFRTRYDLVNWEPLLRVLAEHPTPAACYFGLLAVPPGDLPASLASTFISQLASTPFAEPAKS